MRYVLFFFWLLLIILGMSFAALNARDVLINYYVGQAYFTLPLVLFAVLSLGIALGILVTLPTVCKARYNAKRYRQRARRAEEEVNNLRRVPIQENC